MTAHAPRTFLLTGVTGFLGKVMLEELVRRKEELGIDRIGVVIRPLRGRRADERFRREVVNAECFSLLPDGWSRIVTVLEGNLEQPGLSLDASHTKFLREVTHVVHAAASIKFHLPVAVAARANVTASLNVLEVARTLPILSRFVYVSTAYVVPEIDGQPIEEKLVVLPAPAAELYAACTQSGVSEAELLARTGHPNSYTLTKAIAEHMLVERRGDIPITIIRPSIITASRQHPFPGWIDSMAGYTAFVMLAASGYLRAIVADKSTRLDLIPVDEVARRVVQVCLKDTDDVVIRHAVVGVDKSPTVAEQLEIGHVFFDVNRVNGGPRLHYVGARGIRFIITDLLGHRLPILMAGRKSAAKKRQAQKLGERLANLNEEFSYFSTRTFDFRTSLPLDDAFDGRAFTDTINRGVYRHLMKGDESEWVLGGREHQGRGGDLRWVARQPNGNFWIRAGSFLATKLFARSVDAVTVDVASFERARALVPVGATLVLTPSHRSYLDFVLTSFLAFARPDLLPIPHIAATMEFARIPLLGSILESMHAFYLRRGEGPDPDLARRVDDLIAGGNTLAFFIEGGRSRTGEFLEPRRGLLRCLQATERSCALLPIALTYERVPERAAFARELAGEPKQKMRLGALVSWALDAWRGRVDLGRIHIACGTPVLLDVRSDVHAVSHAVIDRLRDAMLVPDVCLDGALPDDDEQGEPAASGAVVETKSAR